MHKWFRLVTVLAALAGACALAPAAHAQGCGTQNPNCIVPTAPVGTSNNQAASTAFVLQNVLARLTGITGDCTVSSLYVIICAKTNGVPFYTGLPSPVLSTDAATKGYVDSVSSGLNVLAPSGLATAAILPNSPTYANGTLGVGATLTAGSNSTLTVDGVVAVLTTVVLVKNQAAPSQNGIYTVTTAGSGSVPWVLTRATYFDQAAEMKAGSYTFITAGTVNANSAFTMQTAVSVVGTDPSNWILFSQSGTNINTLTGSINLLPGNGTLITTAAPNITIGNSYGLVSIKDPAYGAKCDAIFASSQNFAGVPSTVITINSGSPNLTSTGSTFVAGDVGKSIWVPGAGAAGAGLSTTIKTFTDATHVVLNANASTTVTSFTVTNANPLVYGTDDTAAIQAAMTATPIGGILDIPGSTTGCLIKRQGANNYALLQDHPFSIRGHGHFSNLMTDPSIPSTVDDILIQAGAYAWDNLVWENFSVGDMPSFIPSTFLMYPRHGRRGIWWSAPGSGFLAIQVRNDMVGESGNDYSLYIDGPATSHIIVTGNRIFGGIRLDSVADSNRLIRNDFRGFSIYGGVIDTPLAGMFEFVGNNVTWTGGLKIESGSQPTVKDNYFEEGGVTSESNNAMVDFNGALGTIQDPHFQDNIVNATTSTTSTPVRYSNSVRGIFGGNTISTSNARTGVANTNTLSCVAPNNWAGPVSPHFSTSLANTYAGC